MASTPGGPRGLRISDGDRRLLAFLAEHRFALAVQAARLTGVSPASAARRLGRLRTGGLVRREQPLRHDPPAYAVTRRGLAAADSDLTVPRAVDLATYRHDVGVAWLAVAAHRGLFGELAEVVSERRMRSEDRRADRDPARPRHGVRLADGERGARLHYPDLVLETASGHRVAFELELSTKEPARRERILAAYAADPRIDAVVYLVGTRAAGEAITRSAARVGARELVGVQRFRWAGDRAPGTRQTPRATTRRAAREAGR